MERTQPKPLYAQLQERLAQQIKTGNLPPHGRLPSERELCDRFDVSRITVRRALAELESARLVYRSQGKGTFVAPPSVEQQLLHVTPFAQTLRDRGIVPSTQLHSIRTLASDFETAAFLALPTGSMLLQLELVGLGDDRPVVYYVSRFPEIMGRKMADLARRHAEDGEAFSTWDLYRDSTCPTPMRVSQSFEAQPAENHMAEVLQLAPGTPILAVTSIIYEHGGRPIEYKIARYRGDTYRFHLTREVEL